jgi:hypothetical protein
MLTVIVPTFQRYDAIHIIVNAFLVQTVSNWRMLVVGDGHDPKKREILRPYLERPGIEYHEIEGPHGGVGHEARNYGLGRTESPYVLMTSDDNYYVPTFVEEIEQAVARSNPDLILFDMLHNHYRYDAKRFLRQEFRPGAIDMGGFVARTELARCVGGIPNPSNYCGDWDYVAQLLKAKSDIRCERIERCLYVHN